MSRRKNTFNSDLAKEFSFLKKRAHLGDDVSGVYCEICNKTFSISNSGRSQIVSHIGSKGHKEATQAKTLSSRVTSYLTNRVPNKSDLQLAAKEATFSYHVVCHDQSFRSMDWP